jgi:energy-coupling factor transport system permease protein
VTALIPGMHVRDTWLFRLDPRVKLWFGLLGMIVGVLSSTIPLLLMLLALAHMILLAGGIPARRLAAFWLTVLPILLIILVLQPLMTRGETLLVEIGPIRITWEGLRAGLIYGLRLAAVTFVMLIPFATTPTPKLVRGMVRLGMPDTLGMTVALALNYLGTVGNLYTTVSDAQQARGWDLSQRGIIKRARAAVPTLIAVIIASLRLSDTLALGLAARGFGLARSRTIYRDIRMTRSDWTASVITTLAFAAILGIILFAS